MSIQMAKVSNAPVPAVMMATEDELKTAPVVIVDEKGEERPVEAIVAAVCRPPSKTVGASDTESDASGKPSSING